MCAGADGGQPSPFLFELCERRSGGKHYEYQAQDTPFLGNADPSHPEISQMVEALWMLFRGRFLNHKAVKSYRTKEVDFFDNGKAMISLDGAVWENGSTPMKIGIHQEWVNFIIPG